jgi:hypothetical protein
MVCREIAGLHYKDIIASNAFPDHYGGFPIGKTANGGVAQFHADVFANLLGKQTIGISRKNFYAPIVP